MILFQNSLINSFLLKTKFQQRFDESFYEAWDRFNDLLRACPHHGFSELHQLDSFYNALNANDQDSLNYDAGGNFLDKMPRKCLRIIESKSKVRNSQNKAVVAKNMMKTMLIDKKKAQALVPVKAVEQSCVTCGGAHSYRNCPATDGNVYRDNIQEYVSQAAAANFNQGNTNSRPPMVANQIRPPGFPPIEKNQNRFNQNQGNNFNQNRGTNFNQNRGNNFCQGQGSLPSNTVTNPKEDLKGITTRSGVAYQGPTIPTSSPKVVERRTESGGGVVDLTGDEDPTDEDGDIGVSVSLGDEIFLEGKKSQESNIGDSDNTGDGGKIAGRAIITWGGGIASLISESEGTIVE
ncbi:hypothetical protein Tco_0802547 [Tanacetum coccineum]|uniref:Retrotransposon gag domain-containing protein n=1 Tax=Tanacetum coccineum TaxID=301880 RepID=A0ABQ4ZZ41_9ASTR